MRLVTQLHRTFIVLFALIFAPGTFAAKYRNLDVLVNPTVTFLGEQQPPADPVHNPIRYRLLTRGFSSFELHVHNIPPPDRDALLQHLVIRLREIGYLPADAEHPPQVAIGVMWGSIFYTERETTYLQRRRFNPAYAADRNPNKDELIPAQTALEFMAQKALSMKWRPNFDAWVDLSAAWPDASTAARDRIARICGGENFVLAVGAFDWANLTKGREVVLWQTRGAVSARKVQPEDAFPRMIEVLAPYFATKASYPSRIVARKDAAARALNFGFDADSEKPAPVDLTDLVAHDFGDS